MNGNTKAGSKQTKFKDKQAKGHLLKKIASKAGTGSQVFYKLPGNLVLWSLNPQPVTKTPMRNWLWARSCRQCWWEPEEPDTHREYTWPQGPGLMTKSGPTRIQAAPTSSLAPGQTWAWTLKNDTGLVTRWVTLASFFELLINRMGAGCMLSASLAAWEAELTCCLNSWCHLDESGFGSPPLILFWQRAWPVTSGTPHFQSKSVLHLLLPAHWHHLFPGWLQHLKPLEEDLDWILGDPDHTVQ